MTLRTPSAAETFWALLSQLGGCVDERVLACSLERGFRARVARGEAPDEAAARIVARYLAGYTPKCLVCTVTLEAVREHLPPPYTSWRSPARRMEA